MILKSACDATIHLDFFASELCLRGDAPVAQPHVSENGDVLCWNGEVCITHLSESNGSLLTHIRRKDFRRVGRTFYPSVHTGPISHLNASFAQMKMMA
jgi:hypothetical protein